MKVEIYLDDMLKNLSCRHRKELAEAKLMNSAYGLYHFKASKKGEFVPVYVWRFKSKRGTISVVLNLMTFASNCYATYIRLKNDTPNSFGDYYHRDKFLELSVPVFEVIGIQQLNYVIPSQPYCLSLNYAQIYWRLQKWNEAMMYQSPEPQVYAMKGLGCLGYGYCPKGEARGWFMCLTCYGHGQGYIDCPAADLSTRALSGAQVIYDKAIKKYFELENGVFRNPRDTKVISSLMAGETWKGYLRQVKDTNPKRFKKISSYEHPVAMYCHPWSPSVRIYFDNIPCWVLGVDDEYIYVIYSQDFNRVERKNISGLNEMRLALPQDKNFIG